MPISLKNMHAITLFVRDAKKTKLFYQKVFDVTPIFEDANSAAFMFDKICVNLLSQSEVPGLIDPAKAGKQESGSRFLLTVFVEDVDAACVQLASHGVELVNGPINRPWGLRTISFADPDGHLWEIAQSIS